MKSVLYTSVLQTPILLLGSLIILVLGFRELGGWDEMMRICGAVTVNDQGNTMTELIRSNSDPNFPWLGALIGSAIIGFWYWCTDQFIVQRVLSGKNQKEARRGTIFGAYLKLLPVFLFLIPGMIAFALHQKYLGAGGEGFLPMLANGSANADAAFPTLVAKLLPAGVKGLVVCGILAALMSSLASLFNSSAMLFTIDFYKRFKPKTSEKKLVVIGQMATVVIVILGILWIPIMRSVGDVLYTYLQDVQSVLAPGIAAAFLLGICWKRTSAQGGMWNAEKFIVFCQACSRYGACWACPPHGFDADEYLSGYRTALIIGTRIIPEPSARAECATPEQGRQAGQRMIVEVRRTLDARLLELERKYPGSRAFYAGTCHLCPEGTCARSEGRPCRYPDRIRPSLESLGFDIGKTASELLGIELKWSEPGSSGLPEYFTLVSGFFSSRPANDGSW